MSKKKVTSIKRMTFKEAVAATPDIANGFQKGLQALERQHSSKIVVGSTHDLQGSVNIDKTTQGRYPQDSRWDYAFAYKGQVYFVEFHSAKSDEVRTMRNKLQWLKKWLNSHAPNVKKLQADEPFHWIQSKKFDIKGASQLKSLAQIGLRPKPNLTLD